MGANRLVNVITGRIDSRRIEWIFLLIAIGLVCVPLLWQTQRVVGLCCLLPDEFVNSSGIF